MTNKKVTIKDSFKLADDVLRQGVQGIIEVITQRGIMNCDFADVRTIMKDSGVAHMGIGVGKGENAAQDAVRAAIERILHLSLQVLQHQATERLRLILHQFLIMMIMQFSRES